MKPERWRQITEIFHAALARDEAERAAFVGAQCGEDTALRREVEAMIAAHQNASHFGDSPVYEAPTLEAGSAIGPYRIDHCVGAGGMGVVYRAQDTKLNRPVAIKFLSEDLADATARRRFLREAQMASSLNHPHILTVHDAGEFEDRPYLVTEFVDGGTLDDWAKAEQRTSRQVVGLLIGVADGLAAAHGAGILHRDIKPANILVASNGYAKLADFGLAKLAEGADSDPRRVTQWRTGARMVIGTTAYMSPEQASGKRIDARSDIFSFGIVLYEMLAGRKPFEGATSLELMEAVIQREAEPLPATVPLALRMVVEKALEKDPADRYQSMRDLVVDLRRVVRQTKSGAQTDSAVVENTSRRWQRLQSPVLARERRLWAVAVAVLALVSVALAAALYRAHEPATVRTHLTLAIGQKGAAAFEIGIGIAEAVRRESGDFDMTTRALEGSIGPARLLDAGEAQLGLVSNLVAFHTVKTDRLLGHRASFAGAAVLYRNPAQILVRRDASIASLQDLRGKRVSLGAPGVGEGFNSEILLSHFGILPGGVTVIQEDVEPSLARLLDGSLDAYICWRAVPLPEISKAMASGRLGLLAVDGELVDGLRLNHPFLIPLTIPKGTYPNQDAPVSTVSSKMLLVASTSVPPRVIEQILNIIATHIPDLIARHPAASEIDLKKRPTVADGMSIDLHPGAEMFYQRPSRP